MQLPKTSWLRYDCLRSSVVYQATVSTEDGRPAQTYVGLTENSFKTRLANHKSSFNDRKKSLSTELSKHVWQLKDATAKIQNHVEDFKTNLSL